MSIFLLPIQRIDVNINGDNLNIHEETGDIWLGGAYRFPDVFVNPPLTYSSVGTQKLKLS